MAAIFALRPLLLLALPQSDGRRALDEYRGESRSVSLDSGRKSNQALRPAGGEEFRAANLLQLQLSGAASLPGRPALHRSQRHAGRRAAGETCGSRLLEQPGELGGD